jgi:hypothetical protein
MAGEVKLGIVWQVQDFFFWGPAAAEQIFWVSSMSALSKLLYSSGKAS